MLVRKANVIENLKICSENAHCSINAFICLEAILPWLILYYCGHKEEKLNTNLKLKVNIPEIYIVMNEASSASFSYYNGDKNNYFTEEEQFALNKITFVVTKKINPNHCLIIPKITVEHLIGSVKTNKYSFKPIVLVNEEGARQEFEDNFF